MNSSMFRVPKTTMPTICPVNQGKKLKESQSRCSYLSYECSQPCLDGYTYCVKHVLEDQNAPFKQCNFVYNTNGRKCQNAAPKLDRREASYCPEHTRKAQLLRIKSTSKHSLPQTPEMLLLNLNHYVKPTNLSEKDAKNLPEKSNVLDPFTEIEATKVNAKVSDILDYASSSDSDVEPATVSDTIRGIFLDDSDTESVHSPQEDPLKHAGIFTAEEVIYIAREKLIRLQSLYIDQFRRLQYTLREKRRKYLHSLKKEKETLCSIHNQPKEGGKEKKIYDKLKALNRYHRRSGFEAILYRKSVERRVQATEGQSQKPPSVPKCIFTEGGVKCGERTLPSAKHCRKHILSDQNQVLFKACGAIMADIECHEPVPVIFDSNCVFHMNLPPQCKLEPMRFEEKTPINEETPMTMDGQSSSLDNNDLIDVRRQEIIDPDDDMAGIMRELNDTTPILNAINNSNNNNNDGANSEASTETTYSITPHTSDLMKDIQLSN
ncbi:KAT8 regulatory NSL complex subunit 2 isoform X2 [Leptopilina boulardi]|uniref:KAT8 regulatory NSL complex subunit 2 isoform X2 n=1 Tax=Leptopilina boulardi TaxID=63433 RepID=UPI0021F5FB11|nr:KAT8 regulatory NSL complex subunit 2 isoform X2 [Leptopilina boulardi]